MQKQQVKYSAGIERGAGGSQRNYAGAGRATASLPGAIIGGAHASVSLSVARPGLHGILDFGLAILDSKFFQNPKSKIPNRQRRAAFTLTEILIVISLIVLLLAMAVPAFNFISGGRSIDGAQNVVSAMLGRARARAIETERYAGVAFYLDPATGRSTMTIIVQRDGDATVGGEDPYLNYKGWRASPAPPANGSGSPVAFQYKTGQEVIAVVADGNINSAWPDPAAGIPPAENRLIVKKFVCLQDHTPDTTNRPPNPAYWGAAQQKFVDFDVDAESEVIPVGVGVQLVNDTKGDSNKDRYVRTGVILFDGRGRLDNIPYGIRQNSAWGVKLGLTADIDAGYYSQLGVALYDLSNFHDAGYSDNDAFVPTIGRYGAASSAAAEAPEETWLDTNSLLLTINRYNGTLVRGE